MRYIILCKLKEESGEGRRVLRQKHLEYIEAHRDRIFVGGPALNKDGTPELMLLIVEMKDEAQAEKFISQEPYWASGKVFDSFEIRSWSQVLPEPVSGALAKEIEKERTKAAE